MTDIPAVVRSVKADLRALMNGVASAAMRRAGLTQDYRVNFGVEVPRLQALAAVLREEHGEDLPPLAGALWKESVRECRILALLLMPPDRMEADLAEEWKAGIRQVELAQLAALHLFSRLSAAADLAFRWIASQDDISQIVGFYTLAHLLRTHQLSERSQQELTDQATAAIAGDNAQVRRAAQCALNRLATPSPAV